jgi:hypothetical protein
LAQFKWFKLDVIYSILIFLTLIVFLLRKSYACLLSFDARDGDGIRTVSIERCDDTCALRIHRRASARARYVGKWEFIYRISLRNWVRSGSGNKSKFDFLEDILNFFLPEIFRGNTLHVWDPIPVYFSWDARIM